MNWHQRTANPNGARSPLTHLASLAVLVTSITVEVTGAAKVGQDATFIAFIPAIIIIVYLEGRAAALVATLLMAAAGMSARGLLVGQIPAADWTRAILLLLSGWTTVLTFHRLSQDLHAAVEVAEARLAAVEAVESRYRWAFQHAAMGFANTNQSGELLQSNPRLCEMTGYSEGELARLRLSELVHPDDRDAFGATLERLDADGSSSSSEVRLSKKDGTTFWTRLTLSSAASDGVPSRSVFVVVDDISERRSAREALRAQKEWLDLALSAGRLGTWRIDRQDATVTGSAKFWDILGMPPGAVRRLEELAGVVHPADWPKLASSTRHATSMNYDAEIRVRRAEDGNMRWIALRGREEIQDSRAVRVGVAADLTERRQTTLLRAAAKKRERLMLEQRHRLSNLFPVIMALVKIVKAPGNDVALYKQTLLDRIRALEVTHLLLSRHAGSSALLHDFVTQELRPYMDTHDIKITGPAVMMPAGPAESFAMILHELSTNSVKYGALGGSRGQLEVQWAYESEDASSDIVFNWFESGQRQTSTAVRRGFGSMIIGLDGAPLVGHSPKLEILERGLRYSLRLSRKEIES
ncbi:PAS domain S-box protein [Mesorhizobium sp. B2-1-8]|uniref:sensor histidine kinase n=1 Tax=unclassified Mesorhizobium TaxID=325217 RepID=UPI00112A93B1|nr:MULTISPECIES: sensor histidine kinase [unclassified Mesorhizobium]MBZ9673819.1 PAS domain S-box protein [Mesorhizobium sp. ES1-3]MBZ9711088.1 PAS domain S-box protein [Mesorhizobium sp. ESP7-2]TPI22379.1 PAS domain S-box protein [Mesorhizobium sp. B3-2-1]UCI16764.1 PAS domain S-box protein [Mesorhizobium sp. B2-1-8]